MGRLPAPPGPGGPVRSVLQPPPNSLQPASAIAAIPATTSPAPSHRRRATCSCSTTAASARRDDDARLGEGQRERVERQAGRLLEQARQPAVLEHPPARLL